MSSIFMAFTVESNLWIAAICLVLLGFDLLGGDHDQPPKWMYILKYMFTTSILLTWLVFSVLLAPTMPVGYLLSFSNLFLHHLTPLLAFLDYLLFDQEMANKKRQVWLALVMPLLYMVFFFAAYAKTGQLPVPYFFLDFQTYGWFSIGVGGIGVVYWIVILTLILLGIASLTQKIQMASRKRPWTVSVGVVAVMLGLPALLTLLSVLIR